MPRSRIEAVRSLLQTRLLDGLVVTHLPHIRYLCGFSGSNGLLLITRTKTLFATDGRYAEQVRAELHDAKVVIGTGPLADVIAPSVRLPRGAKVGFDPDLTTVAGLQRWKATFPKVRWTVAKAILDPLISVKDAGEIDLLKRAISISERVFNEILPILVPGVRESEVAARISYLHKLHGADGDGFESIVASGPRGALPHARPTDRRIRTGELVTIDFGCRYQGYHSDITRTLAIGKPSAKLKRMYAAVLDAQLSSLMAVRAGVPARAVDAEARRVFRTYRLLSSFRHSLGHGLGLQIHEKPRLAPTSPDILRDGHVVTVEPGVYVAGVGGVRIEDDVIVRPHGCELLTMLPKELIVL